jgi:glucuronate isomerase
MKPYLDENFLLQSDTAVTLYHQYAKKMPIIDYHSHLSAREIADDINFSCLGEAWLAGDHYKWRAMRANGVSEEYVTGKASYKEKFLKWAETIPQTIRNPLHHWTHLELQRYFGIHELLSPKTAESIYEQCREKLQSKEFSARNLLRKMNLRLVCTTDDPIDDLRDHKRIHESDCDIAVLPTFRPDKALEIEKGALFFEYISTLEQVSGLKIDKVEDLIEALKGRHDFFHEEGCRLSDHGLKHMPMPGASMEELNQTFQQAKQGHTLRTEQVDRFKGALLAEIAKWNHQKSWVQQFHLGPLRNNSPRLYAQCGPDSGGDSMNDLPQAERLGQFLAHLDGQSQLGKTIIYNLNPVDNEAFATMIANFQDGQTAGKIQFGSAWWFLDQKQGMEDQMNALSRQGLITRFIGMLTDSRSLLSYPRHEYFRRIMCNLIGTDVENGEIPWDEEHLGQVVQDICYNNAKTYFSFDHAIKEK